MKTKTNLTPPTKGKKAIAEVPQLDLPLGRNEQIAPNRLLLDTGNLRLLERGRELLNTNAIDIGQPAVQKRVEVALRETKSFDVQGLATSISYNSFLQHERLIVVNYDGDNYLVIEGNRRLAAVRYLADKPGIQKLSPTVRESLATLPCYVLDGPSVVERALGKRTAKQAEIRLKAYRRGSSVYIGLRHLMETKSWEPASRYEFQYHLILQDGWTLQQVATRFGRSRGVVRRDLQAQVLYRDFLDWEKAIDREHRVTYNAFSEAVRSKSIKKWLGWVEEENRIKNTDREKVFFRYLSSRFPVVDSEDDSEKEEVETPSVERALRQLKAMLDLGDSDIDEALEEGEFETAEVLFETRKEGKFAKRVKGFVRGLKNATASELQEAAQENKERLDELIATAKSVLAQIDGFLKKD